MERRIPHSSDSSAVSVTFHAEPDQSLTFSIADRIDTYEYMYDVDLYWVLWDMIIIGYDEYEGFAGRTWAQIRSCL